jgi:hypothetical protein
MTLLTGLHVLLKFAINYSITQNIYGFMFKNCKSETTVDPENLFEEERKQVLVD